MSQEIRAKEPRALQITFLGHSVSFSGFFLSTLVGGLVFLFGLALLWFFANFVGSLYSLFLIRDTAVVGEYIARAGQFGDQFGVVTCLFTMVSAFLIYLTFSRQAQDSLFSQRERHFFSMFNGFQEMMRTARSESSPGEGGKADERLRKIRIQWDVSLSQARRAGATISHDSLIAKLPYSGCFQDQEITRNYRNLMAIWGYLQEIEKASGGAHELYNRYLMANLSQDEAVLFSLYHVNFALHRGPAEALEAGREFFNQWARRVAGWEVTSEEYLNLFSR